jgi:serine/threonine-protein kinase
MTPAPQPPDGSPAANCGPGHLADTFRAKTGDTQAINQLYRALPVGPDEVSITPAPVGPPARPGDRIGPYELREPLGTGGTCLVFLGWDGSRGRSVAVKVLNWATVYDRPTALRQMRTEAAALARVKHPRVVGFVDFGFDPRWPYLVTEFIDGAPLGELVRSGGSLPAAWATHLTAQVADGLGAVWQAGLVHRDVKPDNVLVGPKGTATLIDFGLAKAPALQARVPTGPELAGTAAYLAPEQARDASVVDLRADVYALGVTYYEALTGRLPFEGRNRMQVIFQHLNAAPVPPTDRAPGIPPLISDLCLWMLAKNPDERPQTADELRTAFAAVMGK